MVLFGKAKELHMFPKWQMCITRIEVNFPLKVKCPSDFCSEIRSMDNNHHRHHLLVTRGKKQNELRKSKLL
ncbi:hypothetical protein ABFA07_005573 [Porites harrisoni]